MLDAGPMGNVPTRKKFSVQKGQVAIFDLIENVFLSVTDFYVLQKISEILVI